MKTELRVKAHSILPGQQVIEIWHDGKFIGTVAGAPGPGVRVITKHPMEATTAPDDGSGVNVIEIKIDET